MKKIFKWVIVQIMIVAAVIVFVCNRKKGTEGRKM